LCIGDELLTGLVLNTNSEWLSKKITGIGGFVNRVTIVGDDVCEISLAINESLERGINCLIISGGLGPTPDDKTLEGVSSALGRKLELSKKAVNMMRKSYERLSIEYQLNEFRLKMAMMPKGSIPIQNSVGIAPAVLIELKSRQRSSRRIFCLPGVPTELEEIFSACVIPILKKQISSRFHVIETTHEVIGVGESLLTPVLFKIKDSNLPQSMYVKTHPKGYTSNHKPKLQIQIVSKGKDRREVQSNYKETFSLLMGEIARLDGKIVS
jgi:molybdenum cofactor synthesis domain-containing protein